MLTTINRPVYEWKCDVCKAVIDGDDAPEYRLTRRPDYSKPGAFRPEKTWDACGPACLVTLAARLQGEADGEEVGT